VTFLVLVRSHHVCVTSRPTARDSRSGRPSPAPAVRSGNADATTLREITLMITRTQTVPRVLSGAPSGQLRERGRERVAGIDIPRGKGVRPMVEQQLAYCSSGNTHHHYELK